jgi:hypothetical protein
MRRLLVVCVALTVLAATTARAENITGLYNTGVDNAGVRLPGGTVDSHYTASGGYNVLTGSQSSSWLVSDSSAQWVHLQTDAVETFTYETTFTVSETADLATLAITGRWASDNNTVDILINGTSTGFHTGPEDFGFYTGFTISDLVYGVNTLSFLVHNGEGGYGGPTGLIVDGLQATTVPEPSTLVLLGIGAISLFAWRRRRQAV